MVFIFLFRFYLGRWADHPRHSAVRSFLHWAAMGHETFPFQIYSCLKGVGGVPSYPPQQLSLCTPAVLSYPVTQYPSSQHTYSLGIGGTDHVLVTIKAVRTGKSRRRSLRGDFSRKSGNGGVWGTQRGSRGAGHWPRGWKEGARQEDTLGDCSTHSPLVIPPQPQACPTSCPFCVTLWFPACFSLR